MSCSYQKYSVHLVFVERVDLVLLFLQEKQQIKTGRKQKEIFGDYRYIYDSDYNIRVQLIKL